jgi:hypothetical protein
VGAGFASGAVPLARAMVALDATSEAVSIVSGEVVLADFVAAAFSTFLGAEVVRPFTVFLPVVFMNEIYEPRTPMHQIFLPAREVIFRSP